jgi:heme-degrading monooxygenase HmoA
VIARVWTAEAVPAQAAAYAEHFRCQILSAVRQLDGFAGATLLQRPSAGVVEIVVLTYWQSLEAIRGFAGDDLEQAVVAAEAAALLTRFDPRVRHYQVVSKEGA